MTQGNGPWKRTGWKDNRKKLDLFLMIEMPFDPLRKIMDEFKNVNGGQTIDDALSQHMADDFNKLTTYREERKFIDSLTFIAYPPSEFQ